MSNTLHITFFTDYDNFVEEYTPLHDCFVLVSRQRHRGHQHITNLKLMNNVYFYFNHSELVLYPSALFIYVVHFLWYTKPIKMFE